MPGEGPPRCLFLLKAYFLFVSWFERECAFSWEGKGCVSHFQHFLSFWMYEHKDLSFTIENVAYLYFVCSSSPYKHWKILPRGQTHDGTDMQTAFSVEIAGQRWAV